MLACVLPHFALTALSNAFFNLHKLFCSFNVGLFDVKVSSSCIPDVALVEMTLHHLNFELKLDLNFAFKSGFPTDWTLDQIEDYLEDKGEVWYKI